MRPLRPNQLEAAVWVEQPKQDRCALCLDMRLGKGIITLHWLQKRNPEYTLIVAPFSAHASWMIDLAADGFSPESFMLLDAKSRPERMKQFTEGLDRGVKIFITNSESLFIPKAHNPTANKPIPTDLSLFNWTAVVWDEFVTLANPKNQATRIARLYLSRARYKIALSGEFTPEGAHQVFEVACWLRGRFMGHNNFWSWRADNFNLFRFEWIPKDTNGIRREFAKFAYILSSQDAGVIEPRVFQRAYCEMPQSIRMEYDKIIRDLDVNIPEPILCKKCGGVGWLSLVSESEVEGICDRCGGGGILDRLSTDNQLVVMNWLHQLAGGFPKDMPHLLSTHKLDLLRQVVDEHAYDQMVVSFRYNKEGYACLEQLQRDGHKVDFINGDTPQDARREVVAAMAKGNGPRILLAQTKVIRYGANLSFMDIMVRYSLPFSYNDVSQSSKRICDQDKNRTNLYIDLICKGTIDETILDTLTSKRNTARLFMRRLRETMVGNIRMMI